MRQLYYTFRTLIRGRGSNIIKTISLTLGLFVGILLFAKIAFELNYNTDYKESENLYIIMANYTINGMKNEPMGVVMGPVPQTIKDSFSDEIEYATIYDRGGVNDYYIGENRYDYESLYGDTLFFQTMGITVLQGNVKDLANPNMVFISDEFARKAFGSENPVGKTIIQNKTRELIVRGVFKQISENNSVRPDAVISFQNALEGNRYFGWFGGDGFVGYVRVYPGADLEKINARMDAAIEPYMEFNPEKNGWGVQYSLWNSKDAYLQNPQLKMKLVMMGVLAIALLLIAALNYVLISISSLTIRAKGIGVHKCNGATTGNVFAMFLWETFIIIGISLLLVCALVFSFKELIEELLEASVAGMFTWKALWVPLFVVVFLFIVSGVLPGRMFSRIPVTQVFRHYTEGKQGWKRPLLFVQFSGVSFIFGLLCVIVIQYRQITTYDLGYQTEGLATGRQYFQNKDVAEATIANFPMVEGVAFSWQDIGTGLSGDFVGSQDKMLFSTRFNFCSYDYASLLGIKIKEGKNIDGPDQVLVNEEYVRLMRWTDSPIGKRPEAACARESVVVGVMEDFVNNSLFIDTEPVLFVGDNTAQGCITVRLKAPYKESLKALNEAVKEAFPTSNLDFVYMPDRMKLKYDSTRRFRDMVIIAFVSILLITLMGLFGYVNDEVRRRSKEIAIRKVNGAEATDILGMLSKGMAWIALPAVTLGTICSYFVGKEWLMQFARSKMSLDIFLFIFIALFVLILIFGTVILKSWYIANDDPVNSIKNE
ncbi:FtsX-like permease family protein [Bacteroides sp. 51]|uniref:ABC transporter permease n=1 Tax=Bacteroides sp. 51 TaxID=2302938 RepID=UPI0013D7ECC0|nr:FtsX-like permease family protein [Bacteroides sp. 51]NDV81377.1 ABC transporter permease [Bacteroides sp. 51]